MPQISRNNIADGARTVTPNDSTDLPFGPACGGIWVSAAGTISCDIGGVTVALGTVPVGYYPISLSRIRATGTTATVLALY